MKTCKQKSRFSTIARIGLGLVFLMMGQLAIAADHPAQTTVQQAVQGVLDTLRTQGDAIKSDPQLLDSTVSEYIVPNLDFTTMTKLSVSKHWRNASDDQKAVLVREFKTFLLNTYTSALKEYGGQDIEFLPFKAGKREDRAIVRSVFKQAGSQVPVIYKLHNKKKGWMVYDIEVSNLSLVIQYKSRFSSEIEANGIDGLIKLLQDKNNA